MWQAGKLRFHFMALETAMKPPVSRSGYTFWEPHPISTNFMVADLMTKATDQGTFIRLRNHMMNVHSELRTSLADTMFKIHGEASLLVERLMRKL